MIQRVGLRCRRILTLRSEALGQAITNPSLAFWTETWLKMYNSEIAS